MCEITATKNGKGKMGNGKLGNGKNDRVEKKCNENLVSRSDGNSCLGNKK